MGLYSNIGFFSFIKLSKKPNKLPCIFSFLAATFWLTKKKKGVIFALCSIIEKKHNLKGEIKMAKYEDPEITSSHKHIKTTATYILFLASVCHGYLSFITCRLPVHTILGCFAAGINLRGKVSSNKQSSNHLPRAP